MDGGFLGRETPCTLVREPTLRTQHARDVTSQGGEDGLLEHLFQVLGITSGCVVEIGAWDGKHLSNTWNLLNSTPEKRWSGLLVEADEARAADLAERYRDRPDVQCVAALVGLEEPKEADRGTQPATAGRKAAKGKKRPRSRPTAQEGQPRVPEKTLSAILSEANPQVRLSPDFEFLSIDVDGADYWLWESLRDTHWKPRVVVIEFNPTIPNHIDFVQPRTMQTHQGSSLRALVRLGSSLGYELAATTTFNAFFLRRDLFPLLQAQQPLLADNSIDALHAPTMTSDIFQLYDGTLVLAGCKKLLWLRRPIKHEDLQVIPKSQRHFGLGPGSGDAVALLEARLQRMVESMEEGEGAVERVKQVEQEVEAVLVAALLLLSATHLEEAALELIHWALCLAPRVSRPTLLDLCRTSLEARAAAVGKAMGPAEAALVLTRMLSLYSALDAPESEALCDKGNGGDAGDRAEKGKSPWSSHRETSQEEVGLMCAIGKLHAQHGDMPQARLWVHRAVAARPNDTAASKAMVSVYAKGSQYMRYRRLLESTKAQLKALQDQSSAAVPCASHDGDYSFAPKRRDSGASWSTTGLPLLALLLVTTSIAVSAAGYAPDWRNMGLKSRRQ